MKRSVKWVAFFAAVAPLISAELPGRYYTLMDAGLRLVREALAAQPDAGLQELERRPGFRHFPSAVLVAAVLHRKNHDAGTLALAQRIGDLLAAENEKGYFTQRLDHHRDTYMWLEAYRLLEPELGAAQRERWRRSLNGNLAALAADVAKRQDYPWYQAPFIGTSPNHYSLWASTVYLGGLVFKNSDWKALGMRVMHRFATVEQAPDGYWGEHSRNGPTTGYDYLTMTGVALYCEHSKDPAALEALRRSTDFHKYFTYPDGTPVEPVNDRNRYWEVSMWGQFGFSHFPDGRRYAEFLMEHCVPERLGLENLGRIAQNALYYHEGPLDPIPQDASAFAHAMRVPAGIRKSGPWVVCLSGIIDTADVTNQFFIDRQGNVSVFHEKLGLIITGANSKNQPELATFSERLRDMVFNTPMSSRLIMEEPRDRLALAYHSFFSVLEAGIERRQVVLRFAITPKGRRAEARNTLQLVLRPGETLRTGAGKAIEIGESQIELGPEEIGGSLRQAGWVIHVPPETSLAWPVRPFNPYANGPERGTAHAVATLATPVTTATRELTFTIEAE